MSTTRKGNVCKRGQKYQNAAAYNPARYGHSRQTKQAAAVSAGGLCARCKEKIEWKKKYDKYKPLTAPKICVSCGERTVKQAYHMMCRSCAGAKAVCAKCGKNENIVESFAPDKSQEIKEEAEFRNGLKVMKERERRTLLREQANGKLVSKAPVTASDTASKAPATASDTASKAPVTASDTASKAPVTASDTVSKAPVTASDTVSKAPVTALDTASTASDTVSKAPVTASDTASKVPATASDTASTASDTASKAPVTATDTVSKANVTASDTVSKANVTASDTASTASDTASKVPATASDTASTASDTASKVPATASDTSSDSEEQEQILTSS